MDEKTRAPKHMKPEHLREEVGVVPLLFVVAFFAMVLVPLACMPFVHEDVSAEKRELAPAPRLTVDGTPNIAVLQEAGDYFADHFAFRGTLVDLDATLKQRLLLTSATDNVVVGTDGWLYYAGTLNDYQRRNSMSDHELLNIASNLSLMQEYVLGQGKGFALAIAPNKNSLYPQHMPYYEIAGQGDRNLERLMPMLVERGIQTVDLEDTFGNQDEVLYFARDSHWNAKGALLVYRSITPFLTVPAQPYDEEAVDSGHTGDVDAMLHPNTARPEADLHWAATDAYAFANDATSTENDSIETTSTREGSTGTLVMYRDSFGNNLIPYFAGAYAKGSFSKLVPYNMGASVIAQANDVVVERAERHIDLFATKPPYMPAPGREIVARGEPRTGETGISLSTNGPYFVVEGTIDEGCAEMGDSIFVELVGTDGAARTVEAFHVSQETEGTQDFEGDTAQQEDAKIRGDWGYRAYVSMDDRGAAAFSEVHVLVGKPELAFEVARVTVGG